MADKDTQSYQLLKVIVSELNERKARDIQVIDITQLTQIGDYFVICTGGSSTQVKALADAVEEKVDKECNVTHHREGYSSASWVLVDYRDVIVHIFYGEARDFYNLERLWADGVKMHLDEIITANA